MKTSLQKSFLLFGPPSSGKDALPGFFREKGARINLFGLGKHLRDLHRQGEPDGIAAHDLMMKREILPDDLVEHIIDERIRIIGNSDPLFLSGIPRRKSQVELITKILSQNGFLRPTVILFDYTPEYCIGRKSKGIEDGTRENRPDDGCMDVFKKGLAEFFDSKHAILRECMDKNLEVFTIDDHEKLDHLAYYAHELDISFFPDAVPEKVSA